MTIPNILTLTRLALTPVIAVAAYSATPAGRFWAFGIFLFAMATDVADGIIAQRPGQASALGAYLDPVADKILLLTMFVVLSDLHLLPLWMAILMIAREFLVNGVRSAAATRGQIVSANRMGKTKALLQTGCIGLGLGVRAFAVAEPLATRIVTGATALTLALAWVFAGVFLWRCKWLFSAPASTE